MTERDDPDTLRQSPISASGGNSLPPSPVRADKPDPAHLYACGVLWEHEREAPAGWELIQALRSDDSRTRSIAATLLAKTRDARVPKRMLRHANQSRKIKGHEDASRAIHGRALVDDCMTCTARNTHGFCALSPSGLKTLDGTSHPITYPDGALVFVEGQHARGAYVLCAGRAKLSTTSRDGKVLILRIAVSGEVLGLSAALSDQPYELTVETSGACHIRFLERQALQGVIQNSPEFGVRASLALSRQIQRAYRDIHELVLARSSTGKLARLLLSWSQNREKPGEEARVPASLTHEEMAQMIGSSRETVTRLLGDLKKRELVRLEGAKLVIRNRAAMEALAA